MTVQVLLFASYAERLGRASLTLEMPSGARVADVLREVQALPGAAELPPRPLIAVNERYAPADHAVAEGDQIALIPPVAGG